MMQARAEVFGWQQFKAHDADTLALHEEEHRSRHDPRHLRSAEPVEVDDSHAIDCRPAPRLSSRSDATLREPSYARAVGMFDWYEPTPPLSCPRCAARLDEWQGKDGECALWVWREGHVDPVDQRVDPEWRSSGLAAPLRARFEIYTTCSQGHHVEAFGEAPDGIWTRTTLITAPVPPRRGASGRWSCPCCGCFTLDEEPPGTFQICPVCWWEDDRVQFDDPDFAGGANAPCLRRARFEYLFTGVADPDHRAHTRPPREHEIP
jgi:hypothetical protein